MRHMQPTKSDGFTIIELTLAISLSIVVVIVFVSILFSTLFSTGRNKAQLELNSNNQVALDLVERDIRFSTAFVSGLDGALFTDPYAPVGGWSYKGSSAASRALLLRAYSSNKNPYAPDRQSIFQNTVAFGCTSTTFTLNPQLPYQTIYFVSNGTLYRRTITNTSLPVCANNGTQVQKQSCPRGIASPDAICAAFDEVILEYVTQFTINYFEEPSDTVAKTVYSSTDPTILDEVAAASVIVTTQQTINNKPVTSTMSIRSTRLN